MKSLAHPASSRYQQRRETALLPSLHLTHCIPKHLCLRRRRMLLTLHQSSSVPGVITDGVTFTSITANKRKLKLQ